MSEPTRPRSGPEPVRLAQNEGAFGPLPEARAAVAEALAEGNRYPDNGIGALHRALADRHGVAAERVLVAGGSTAVIHLLSLALLGPGDEVVFGEPGFVAYRLETVNRGATPVPAPLAADGATDLGALLERVTPRTKLVFVANPNNPTGGMVTRDAVREFLAALPDHVLPVLDEAYAEYVDHPDYPDGVAEFAGGPRPVVVTRTFSKFYGLAGLRVGYGVLPDDLARRTRRLQLPYEVNRLAVTAALASLGADPAELALRAKATATGRERLVAELTALGHPPLPSVANFVQVAVGDAQAVARALQIHGVLVRPLDSWGAPDSIRVTVGTPSELDQFLEAFARVTGNH